MNNGWKCSVQRMDETPARLALFRLGRGFTGGFLALLTTAWLPGWIPFALAQSVPNAITAVTVSPSGDLILTVEGEGFDPLLRLESAANGSYRVVVQATGVTLAPGVMAINTHLGQDFQGKIPAIEGGRITALSGKGSQSGTGVQVILTAWRKLQPQILSNDGHQIVITLIGERSLPPAIAARQRLLLQQAEQARQAAQKLAETKALQQKLAEQKRVAQSLATLPQFLNQSQQTQPLKSIDSKPIGKKQPVIVEKHPTPPLQVLSDLNRQTVYQARPQPEEVEYEAELAQEQYTLAARRREAMARRARLANAGVQTATAMLDADPEVVMQLQVANLAAKPNAISALAQPTGANAAQAASQLVAIAPHASAAPRHADSQRPVYHPVQSVQAGMLKTSGSLSTPPDASRAISPAPFSWLNSPPLGTGSAIKPVSDSAKHNHVAPSHEETTSEAEDTTPIEPLRLTKPPANATPQPEAQPTPTAVPSAIPYESQRPERAPKPTDRTSTPPEKSAFPLPGADKGRMQSIYAVMQDPQANPILRQAWADLMAGQASTAQARLEGRLREAPKDVSARYLLAQI